MIGGVADVTVEKGCLAVDQSAIDAANETSDVTCAIDQVLLPDNSREQDDATNGELATPKP
jgi:hypothetical protein